MFLPVMLLTSSLLALLVTSEQSTQKNSEPMKHPFHINPLFEQVHYLQEPIIVKDTNDQIEDNSAPITPVDLTAGDATTTREQRDQERYYNQPCSAYLTISNLTSGIGRGIFAGRDFQANEIIDTDMALLIPYDDISAIPQIDNYVYGTDHPNISILAIGNGAFYNSHINHTVKYADAPYETTPKPAMRTIEHTMQGNNESLPFLNHTDFAFITLRPHITGEEFFIYYGDEWYATRTHNHSPIPDIPLNSHTMHVPIPTPQEQRQYLETNQYHRVCMNDVVVRKSTITNQAALSTIAGGSIGRGLFATRDFAKGDAITVSPVAVLKKNVVDTWVNHTVLQNYCIWDGQSDVVLFPMSKIAMINHQSSQYANVVIQWFSWIVGDTWEQAKEKVFDRNIQELMDSPVCPLDIVIYATRDINAGDELFLDYGSAWEQAWYEARCNERDQSGCNTLGTFRSYIGVEDGFFPSTWKFPINPPIYTVDATR